jgi:hypothetical protein
VLPIALKNQPWAFDLRRSTTVPRPPTSSTAAQAPPMAASLLPPPVVGTPVSGAPAGTTATWPLADVGAAEGQADAPPLPLLALGVLVAPAAGAAEALAPGVAATDGEADADGEAAMAGAAGSSTTAAARAMAAKLFLRLLLRMDCFSLSTRRARGLLITGPLAGGWV